MSDTDQQSCRAELAPVLGFYAILLMILAYPFMRGELLAAYDLAEQFLPFRAFYAACLEEGTLGLWNPWLGRGHNHLGEGQGGLLHPVHILAYKYLPLWAGIILESLAYYPVAILGMYLFARRCLRFLPLPALLAGGLFGFCTFSLAHFPHINMVWVYVHLPYMLLAVHRCLCDRRRMSYAALLALLYASALLLGHPQQVWINSLAIVMYGVFVLVRETDRRRVIRGAGFVAAGVIFGAALGAPQLVPSVDYVSTSPRGEIVGEARQVYSLEPINLLPNLSPFLFEGKVVGHWQGQGDERRVFASKQETPAYFGIASLALIVIAFVLHRQLLQTACRKESIAAVALLAVTVLLMLGRYGGLNALLEYIPLISQFRAPGRYMSIFCAAIALLAGLALHWLTTRPSKCDRVAWIAVFTMPLLSSLLLLYAILTGPLQIDGMVVEFNRVALLIVGPVVAALTAATVIVLNRCPDKRSGVARLFGGLLLVICVSDIAVCNFQIPLTAARTSFDDFLQKTKSMRLAADQSDFRYVGKLNVLWWQGIRQASGYLGIPPPEPLDLFGERGTGLTRQHLQLVSVRHAVGSQTIFTIPEYMPRLRLVNTVRHSDSPLKDLGAVDLKDVVLCRAEAGVAFTGPAVLRQSSGSVDAPFEHVRVLNETAEGLAFSVATRFKDRMLVLSDTWTADWHATLNGEPVPLIPLFDGVLRGVYIPKAGNHTVEMFYRPAAFYRGLTIAGGSLAAGLALFFLGVFWRKRQSGMVPAAQEDAGEKE